MRRCAMRIRLSWPDEGVHWIIREGEDFEIVMRDISSTTIHVFGTIYLLIEETDGLWDNLEARGGHFGISNVEGKSYITLFNH